MIRISLPLPYESHKLCIMNTKSKKSLDPIQTLPEDLEKGLYSYRILVDQSPTTFNLISDQSRDMGYINLPEDIEIIIHSNDNPTEGRLRAIELSFYYSTNLPKNEQEKLVDFYKNLKKRILLLTRNYTCTITLNGLGLKAILNNGDLELALGKAHTVKLNIPSSVKVEVKKEVFAIQGAGESQRILLTGTDIQIINNIADSIVKLLPPEPYKGKGVIIRTKKNLDKLQVFRKEGKKNKSLMKLLFDAQTHIGHYSSIRHPHIKPYLFGSRKGLDIIDIRQTEYHLRIALQVIKKIYENGGTILFHIDEPSLSPLLKPLIPKNPQIFVHTHPWIGGLLTNWNQIENHVRQTLNSPSSISDDHPFYLKFASFISILKINGNNPIPKPSLVITFKAARAREFLLEADKSLIPSIGFADTNTDTSLITYLIPGNDDNLKALYLYAIILFSIFPKDSEVSKI